jgi:hypothetical protein
LAQFEFVLHVVYSVQEWIAAVLALLALALTASRMAMKLVSIAVAPLALLVLVLMAFKMAVRLVRSSSPMFVDSLDDRLDVSMCRRRLWWPMLALLHVHGWN